MKNSKNKRIIIQISRNKMEKKFKTKKQIGIQKLKKNFEINLEKKLKINRNLKKN